MRITGKELIAMGYTPGPWFAAALDHVNAHALQGAALRAYLDGMAPVEPEKRPLLDVARTYQLNIEAETEAEDANVAAVRASMDILMRTPTVIGGAVMPDACPAGPEGTIPVGGVVAAKGAIHPGMHSADICCSVMVTEFADGDPGHVLDAIHAATHFGPGGRRDGRFALPSDMKARFAGNRFLKHPKLMAMADSHLGTQGDGNHFAFVGVSKARGTTCLVTHHGSRGAGAVLYKQGMQLAEEHRRKVSPQTLRQNAWLDADSAEGVAYWDALQAIRDWTRLNHTVLHDAAAEGLRVTQRFWNEHNLVFREDDVFYHAKGATPVHDGYLPDTNGVQIVPLNMAEPVLLIRADRTDRNLGFAPHGAGRNFSRTAHRKSMAGRTDEEIFADETRGLDARFFCGKIDISELPSAYKDAGTVRAQMDRFGLAQVVDEIMPYGSIMAGDWDHDAPWRKKARARHGA